MTKPLTEQDIKDLKYQCRMGYVLPGLLFAISASLLVFVAIFKDVAFSSSYFIMSALATVFIAVIFSLRMNRKYYIDIKNNVKAIDIKPIDQKEEKLDYEAGSGVIGNSGTKMKEFDKYSFIVENVRYDVEKELFNKCEEGDEVIFYFAPVSMFLLSIEAKEGTSL